MADSRIIRIGILSSDRVNMLNWEEEVFYRRLMSIVDDHGRYDARPSVLRCQLYPLKLDKMSEASIQRCLTACEVARLVRLYSVEGKPYVEIENFGQRLQSKSKWPDPFDGEKPPFTVVHRDLPFATVNNGESPSSTVYTESESDTKSNINNSHVYSPKPDLSVCVPPERLHPHSDSEAFAIFMKVICELRPAWEKVLPHGVEIGLAKELYESVKGSIKPSDMALLKAYLNDAKTPRDRNNERFWRPESRKSFIEGFAGILASAERWKKETKWKLFRPKPKKMEQTESIVPEDSGTMSDWKELMK